MNRNHLLRLCFVPAIMLLLSGALHTASAAPNEPSPKGEMTDTISVPEMQCGMCEMNISKALKPMKGISHVEADSESDIVIVTYDPKTVTRAAIEEAIAGAGYDAGEHTTTKEAQMGLHGCCRPSGK